MGKNNGGSAKCSAKFKPPSVKLGVLLLSPSPREARDILDFKCSGTGIGAPNDYVDFI